MNQTNRLSIVYPSLWKLAGRHYSDSDILLLDEIRQGLEFLQTSSPCDKNDQRPANIGAFNNAITESGTVILADAYSTNVEVDYVLALRPNSPVYLIEIPVSPQEREVYRLPKKSMADEMVVRLLGEGKRVDVPNDSQEDGEALHRTLAEKYPDKKILRIDKKTVNEPEQLLFISDPNKYLADIKPDVVIWSPTLGSGFDMTEGNFDAMVAYNGHLEPTHFMQLIGRDRQKQPLYYFASADKNNNHGSIFAEEQKESITRHGKRFVELSKIAVAEAGPGSETAVINEVLQRMIQNRGENLTLETVSRIYARKAFACRDRAAKVKLQLERDGYTVLELDDEEAETLVGTTTKEKQVNKKEIRKEEAIAVIGAELVNSEEGQKLLDKKELTAEEKAKARRFGMEKLYPGFIADLKSEPIVSVIAELSGLTNQAEEFYYNNKKDGGRWVSTVWERYLYENWKGLFPKDLEKVIKKVTAFKDWDFGTTLGSQTPLNDLQKIKTPFYEWVEKYGLISFFTGDREKYGLISFFTRNSDREFTIKDVLTWFYQVDTSNEGSEGVIDDLMSYLKREDSVRNQREFRSKFIKGLDKEFTDGLKDYFNFFLPDTSTRLKNIARSLNKMLERFGYKLEVTGEEGDAAIYQIADIDTAGQRVWRAKLEESISLHHKITEILSFLGKKDERRVLSLELKNSDRGLGELTESVISAMRNLGYGFSSLAGENNLSKILLNSETGKRVEIYVKNDDFQECQVAVHRPALNACTESVSAAGTHFSEKNMFYIQEKGVPAAESLTESDFEGGRCTANDTSCKKPEKQVKNDTFSPNEETRIKFLKRIAEIKARLRGIVQPEYDLDAPCSF